MPNFIPSHTTYLLTALLPWFLSPVLQLPWSASPPNGKAPLCISLCLSPPVVVLAVLRSRSSVLVSPPFSRHLILSCFFLLPLLSFFLSNPSSFLLLPPNPHHENPSPGKSLSSARLDL
ncbi:hypothetical protein CCMA1212_004747 [Trichoderma ghanense]|uniref:Uncharacterized protein n=1 Tax=Trichoderma ghanense TaxID=65468 RepID=A0ABY2H7Q5_9HYPO